MKFIGYVLIIIANIVFVDCGINVFTWQWWVINICFIIRELIICKE